MYKHITSTGHSDRHLIKFFEEETEKPVKTAFAILNTFLN